MQWYRVFPRSGSFLPRQNWETSASVPSSFCVLRTWAKVVSQGKHSILRWVRAALSCTRGPCPAMFHPQHVWPRTDSLTFNLYIRKMLTDQGTLNSMCLLLLSSVELLPQYQILFSVHLRNHSIPQCYMTTHEEQCLKGSFLFFHLKLWFPEQVLTCIHGQMVCCFSSPSCFIFFPGPGCHGAPRKSCQLPVSGRRTIWRLAGFSSTARANLLFPLGLSDGFAPALWVAWAPKRV